MANNEPALVAGRFPLAAFRFLRQPSRLIAPRPVAKSGKAAGEEVGDRPAPAAALSDHNNALSSPRSFGAAGRTI
jgi:hypothetical protein